MHNVNFRSDFLLWFATCILIVPIKWLFCWIAAVAVHELSHYIVLKLYRVKIYSITIHLNGAAIETEPMAKKIEIISALAGPLGGLCLLLTSKCIPLVAICAFCQSVYNLLPIYPLDGGRILRCCLLNHFGDVRGVLFYDRIELLVLIFCSILSIGFSWIIRSFIPVLFLLVLIFRSKHLKIPCNAQKQIVQ